MYVLGLMSGTSMDGLDCCLAKIHINSQYIFKYSIIKTHTYYYNKLIKTLIYETLGSKDKSKINYLDKELGQYFNKKCLDFIGHNKVDLIASHGQTISHEGGKRTIQVGSPKFLFNSFKIPVVYNFRIKDIKNHGQGAPLSPFLDWLLFKDKNNNCVLFNIGGISNVTYITKSGLRNEVIGFDTGPGMCLIDEFVKLKFNDSLDKDCAYSKYGKVNDMLLSAFMKDKFIFLKPPKSTSREKYDLTLLKDMINKFKNVSDYDFLRTLVKYTSESIFKNIELFIGQNTLDEIIISGGGSNHKILVNYLKENFSNLYQINHYGICVDFKEALLMCVMGYCCYKNIPNNMPSVTGANKLDIYGKIYKR